MSIIVLYRLPLDVRRIFDFFSKHICIINLKRSCWQTKRTFNSVMPRMYALMKCLFFYFFLLNASPSEISVIQFTIQYLLDRDRIVDCQIILINKCLVWRQRLTLNTSVVETPFLLTPLTLPLTHADFSF